MSLGIRWGMGHSTGLVVVAAIFISLKGEIDLRKIGRVCDTILGVFMMTLGCYGIMGAIQTYREKSSKRDPDISKKKGGYSLAKASSSDALSSVMVSKSASPDGSNDVENKIHHHPPETFLDFEFNDMPPEATECQCCSFINMRDPITQRCISFCIGILHGVAGPGAILGVLPAVEMQSLRASSIYLGSFIVASTLSMGTFAALYGELTKRLGSTAEFIELGLRVFSSSLSVIVGILWLVLSLMGKLEDFFH